MVSGPDEQEEERRDALQRGVIALKLRLRRDKRVCSVDKLDSAESCGIT